MNRVCLFCSFCIDTEWYIQYVHMYQVYIRVIYMIHIYIFIWTCYGVYRRYWGRKDYAAVRYDISGCSFPGSDGGKSFWVEILFHFFSEAVYTVGCGTWEEEHAQEALIWQTDLQHSNLSYAGLQCWVWREVFGRGTVEIELVMLESKLVPLIRNGFYQIDFRCMGDLKI